MVHVCSSKCHFPLPYHLGKITGGEYLPTFPKQLFCEIYIYLEVYEVYTYKCVKHVNKELLWSGCPVSTAKIEHCPSSASLLHHLVLSWDLPPRKMHLFVGRAGSWLLCAGSPAVAAPTVLASPVAERGLHQLQHMGSGVAAHRLSPPSACGVFPDQGPNPCPLDWQADS